MSRRDPYSSAHAVGTVLSVTPTGFLTLRAPGAEVSEEGTLVTDRTGRLLGRVARVFGPVEHPYLSVRLKTPLRGADLPEIVGSTLRRDPRGKR